MEIIYYSGMNHCNLKAIHVLICQVNISWQVYKMISNNKTTVNNIIFLPNLVWVPISYTVSHFVWQNLWGVWGRPQENLKFLPSFKLGSSISNTKLTQNCCINMWIFLFLKTDNNHKFTPPLLHTNHAWKTILTIWQNMKVRGIQKSQFSNSFVNS